MKDYLVKAMAFNGEVRVYAVNTTATINEAQRRHQTYPTASAALGRAMTVGVMMGAMLKGDNKITIKIEGDGPIGSILVDANAQGGVRGYVTHPQTHLPLNEFGKLDVAGVVGTTGVISVVKDLGLRENYTGQSPIVCGELGLDFANYFVTSEQTPTAVGVGVLVDTDNTIKAAGGFVIQMMPGASEATAIAIEQKVTTMTPVSKLIEQGLTPEQILVSILGKENIEFLSEEEVNFQCTCSRTRFEDAIISLGKHEIESLIEEGQAEADCHFCREKYIYTIADLEKMKDLAI